MQYQFKEIEAYWQKKWANEGTYRVSENPDKEKFYVLDMFPYPSGAGLHVGHPLGYIASDIIARYKVHQGYEVLHPMGYDSFGLPAEQYAIQTGQHPAITTEENIARYRTQLERMGFNYDWEREVRTSDPSYYRWTQWIFQEIYNSWFNVETKRAEPISDLEAAFAENGSYGVNAAIDADWYKALDLKDFHFGEYFIGEFTSTDWQLLNAAQRSEILSHYRLAFLADTWVNWCPALGTVLANDEIKDGVSERGGHPVEQRLMKQWSLRITAYADRLIEGLEGLDWPDSIKEIQRNWIGKSRGATVRFQVEKHQAYIDVFTTRPDTIFGVTFMVLAPEHALVSQITTTDQQQAIEAYIARAKARTERERQSEVKHVSGAFTGAYAAHPFSGERLPIWIGDYVLAGYGTGAIMAVPAGDQRDWSFAHAFDLPIVNIFDGQDISKGAYAEKTGKLAKSGFLNGLEVAEATEEVIRELELKRIGYGKTNYRLRDAIFSRQRYWGEPIPVYYEGGQTHLIDQKDLPLTLPKIDSYLPTDSGEPPLARAAKSDWPLFKGEAMEHSTMPGWAGSSWYFLRYMDPKNTREMVAADKVHYWGAVDLYMGGAEHATGHLLYSRFWTKFLCDRGFIPFEEPFQKMINQGMILGRSSLVHRLELASYLVPGVPDGAELPSPRNFPVVYVTKEIYEDWAKDGKLNLHKFAVEQRLETLLHELLGKDHNMNLSNAEWEYSFTRLHVDVNMVRNDELDLAAFAKWRTENADAVIITNEDGVYKCSHEIEKMSKRWFNVVTPDDLCEEYGADTLRLYEMFLGPVEQSKPWDTQGISGVHNFLKRFWRLCHPGDGEFSINRTEPTPKELFILHRTIKRVTEDLDRFSWNTVVSTLMIAVNDLTTEKSSNAQVLEGLLVLTSPYAPHFAEELWKKLGHSDSITREAWPTYDEKHLEEANFEYPVSFNGKTRFKLSLSVEMGAKEVEAAVMALADTAKYLEGKDPKKIIVVPKRIVNIVF